LKSVDQLGIENAGRQALAVVWKDRQAWRKAADLVGIRLEIDPTERQNPEDTGQADNIVGGMNP